MNTTNGTQDVTTQEAVWVTIDQIVVPGDARPHTQEDIDCRAISMDREGQAQNALLSKEGDKLVLIYGHGRLLSAQTLGWEKLRCDIKEGLTEVQKLKLALAENAERENESPFYTAGLYQRLKDASQLNQKDLAQELKKDESLVGKYLSLNQVTREVQEKWNRFHFGIAHCLELAKLASPEDQAKVAEECAAQDWSVKELKSRVQKLIGAAKTGTEGAKPPKEVPLFQFTWKNADLLIRARYSAEKPLEGYLQELHTAIEEFLTRPQKQPKAAPSETPKVEEVAAAAEASPPDSRKAPDRKIGGFFMKISG